MQLTKVIFLMLSFMDVAFYAQNVSFERSELYKNLIVQQASSLDLYVSEFLKQHFCPTASNDAEALCAALVSFGINKPDSEAIATLELAIYREVYEYVGSHHHHEDGINTAHIDLLINRLIIKNVQGFLSSGLHTSVSQPAYSNGIIFSTIIATLALVTACFTLWFRYPPHTNDLDRINILTSDIAAVNQEQMKCSRSVSIITEKLNETQALVEKLVVGQASLKKVCDQLDQENQAHATTLQNYKKNFLSYAEHSQEISVMLSSLRGAISDLYTKLGAAENRLERLDVRAAEQRYSSESRATQDSISSIVGALASVAAAPLTPLRSGFFR